MVPRKVPANCWKVQQQRAALFREKGLRGFGKSASELNSCMRLSRIKDEPSLLVCYLLPRSALPARNECAGGHNAVYCSEALIVRMLTTGRRYAESQDILWDPLRVQEGPVDRSNIA